MIAGIFVLALFLTAFAAMILINQEYDSYQSVVNTMQQKDSDRFSENIVVNNVTLTFQNSTINQYALNMSNYGIGVQVARIYISSTTLPGCTSPNPAPCILDASNGGTYKFQMSSAFLNPGESYHIVIFWLPRGVTLPLSGRSTILVATTRGRVFAIQWPLPTLGPPIPGFGLGGQGIDFGPLVIKYESVLMTYDVNGSVPPPLPIDGGWIFPSGSNTYIIIYVKIANQANTPVSITTQSLLQMQQLGTTGAPSDFWLVAPMDTPLCTNTFAANPLNVNMLCGCLPAPLCPGSLGEGSYSGGNTHPEPPHNVIAYSFTTQPYIVPPSSQNWVCCGPPIYLLFGASTSGGSTGAVISVDSKAAPIFYVYLDIVFQFNDVRKGLGTYTYGVNLPFITICAGPGPYAQSCLP